MSRDDVHRLSRRGFNSMASRALASLPFVSGCRDLDTAFANDGRINSRPRTGTTTTATDGALGLDRARDAVLRLPTARVSTSLPLLVLLHGAGGRGMDVLDYLGSAATDAGLAVLAPDARTSTWDAVRGGFGPDVTFIDRALARVFEIVSIDPARIAIGGFSDGASYAISLGLINGDLFPRVAAFSPGFVVNGPAHGRPEFFVSHGRSDPILPIDRCSRIIVAGLRGRGYTVTFREFDGGHEVPEGIAVEAMRWMAERRA